jgi:hypothetical protein
MILDFNLFRSRMVVGIITWEKALYHQIPAHQSDIDEGVFNLQDKLKEFTLSGRSTFMGHAWKEPCRRLHRTLLGSLPPLPSDKTTIFVIPDQSLWYLPFPVLLDAEDRPLGSGRLVSLIPSTDILRFVRSVDGKKANPTGPQSLLLLESLPWASEDDVRQTLPDKAPKKAGSIRMSEGERIERLILKSPVYPKPSEIVIKIQKMFKKSDVRVGQAATVDCLLGDKDRFTDLAVMAVPLAVTDSVSGPRRPSLFFSPDKQGRRRFDVSVLFKTHLDSKLLVLPSCWFDVPDKDAAIAEGPLLLSTAVFYSGVRSGLLNYSKPDWGNDDAFLLTVLEKTAQGVPLPKALAEYPRMMPGGPDPSLSGKPPAWSGWILFGDPVATEPHSSEGES